MTILCHTLLHNMQSRKPMFMIHTAKTNHKIWILSIKLDSCDESDDSKHGKSCVFSSKDWGYFVARECSPSGLFQGFRF